MASPEWSVSTEGFEATPEMRASVKRDECRLRGHAFSEIVTRGSRAPQLVVCTNCGSRWRVHPEDTERNFGVED